jgi:hypothetical protein
MSAVESARGSMVDHRAQVDKLWSLVRDLRAVADFLADHADALPGDVGVQLAYYPVLALRCHDAPAMARTVKWVGGGAKRSTDYLMHVERSFGGLVVDVTADREEVCRKVKVGTRTVTVPAPDAPTIEVEEDVYEWECNPILGTLAGES